MGVGGQRHVPAALPPGKTRYPSYRTLGGPEGRSGRVQKLSPVPGFDPRTVQPVTSNVTNHKDTYPINHSINQPINHKTHTHTNSSFHVTLSMAHDVTLSMYLHKICH